MDFFQLECFASVLKNKSFTEAAYNMSISQSSLSKHIAKLEDELNVKLFNRSKKNVSLTLAGEEFLEHATLILRDFYKMENSMKRYLTGGIINIGSIEHMGKVGLTTPIATFFNKYPGVEINIEIGDTVTLMNMLIISKIDIAFIAHLVSRVNNQSNLDSFDLKKFKLYTLIEDDYCVIVNEKHEFAEREYVNWEDLKDEKLVILDNSYSLNSIIKGTFSSLEVTPNIVFESNQVDTLLGLVSSNFGISLFSNKIAKADYNIRVVKLNKSITRNTVLVIPNENEKINILKLFTEHIEDYYDIKIK
jgi:DNA-binding transcriptional LysR family regulator